MIELLARLFIRNSRHTDDPRVRTAYGMLCSAVAITLNILLAAAKFVVGTLAGSVSITADAMNNFSDVGSGALTLVGFRLSGKKPDLEHPFGHGRIEYVMGLVIAGLILYAGVDALRGAAGKLLHPETMEFTWAVVAVLALSILVKIYMSVFYRRIGRKIGSTAMEMSGADALNDTISTALTLVCLLIYKFTGLDLDAYAGIVVAVLLLKTGYEGGKETLGQLLGQRRARTSRKRCGRSCCHTRKFSPSTISLSMTTAPAAATSLSMRRWTARGTFMSCTRRSTAQ